MPKQHNHLKGTVWEYIKADKFFPAFLPQIKNYSRKIQGKNWRGNPIGFSREEQDSIMLELAKLIDNCQVTKKNKKIVY